VKDDPGFWASLAGAVVAGFGTLFGVWKHTHRRIDVAYAEIAKKADNEEMKRQRDNIKELFQSQSQHRDAVMTELRSTNELLGQIHVAVTRELGARPTRDEVERMIEKGRTA
jgi:hypothetical protein